MNDAKSDRFALRRQVRLGGDALEIIDLGLLARQRPEVARLPFSLLILLENLLAHDDGSSDTELAIEAIVNRSSSWGTDVELNFFPSRVIMQDYSGLVALTDLATIRDAAVAAGLNPSTVQPALPVTFVVDHSLVVECYGAPDAAVQNVEKEYSLNAERYRFLKWAQANFENLRVVPPGGGIIHQVNLEHIATVISTDRNGIVHPETQIGTDSHTTMVNGLGILGWGVGGMEAEAAVLGEPVSLLAPDVVGVKLKGATRPGVLATDLVLMITERLREFGVVEKFVEFFGPGIPDLTVPDRATIANMAPEYGATCGLFPIDEQVVDFLKMTGRPARLIESVVEYARMQGLWANGAVARDYADVIEVDLSVVGRSVAGPSLPQQLMGLSDLPTTKGESSICSTWNRRGEDFLREDDVVIAAITSCTNTSNPRAMITAGLLAKNAVERGLSVAPYVKTSLAPGSRSVQRYLTSTGLLQPLEQLGFSIVGFACTTCVGNSGPLNADVERQIIERELDVAAVLSGNRNFEGRIHPLVRSNYLASPPLVVAYALAGTTRIDLTRDPIGVDAANIEVFLDDLWPESNHVSEVVRQYVTRQVFLDTGEDIFRGGRLWDDLEAPSGEVYAWEPESTYLAPSPLVFSARARDGDIARARPLLVLGDSVTTDHISPVGQIEREGPAAEFLRRLGVPLPEFNSYGSRRSNYEVMVRGTFANIRLNNALAAPRLGGFTRLDSTGDPLTIHEAATTIMERGDRSVVLAGWNYGTGSARDWAAKGTRLLGVEAVVARSFERIHRANLAMAGVLPVETPELTESMRSVISPEARISVLFDKPKQSPRASVKVVIEEPNGGSWLLAGVARLDTRQEVDYYRAGGVLPHVRQRLVGSGAQVQVLESSLGPI